MKYILVPIFILLGLTLTGCSAPTTEIIEEETECPKPTAIGYGHRIYEGDYYSHTIAHILYCERGTKTTMSRTPRWVMILAEIKNNGK